MAENGGSLGALDPIALAGSALRLEDFLLDAHPQLHPGQDVWQRGGQHAPVRQVMIASFPPSNCSLRWPSGVGQEGCVNKSVSRGSLTTGSPGAAPPSDRLSDLALDAQQCGNGVRWSAAKSALGGNAEICYKLLCCFDALERSFHAIGEMYQSQVEFCFRM